jgi:hypothetical protein
MLSLLPKLKISSGRRIIKNNNNLSCTKQTISYHSFKYYLTTSTTSTTETSSTNSNNNKKLNQLLPWGFLSPKETIKITNRLKELYKNDDRIVVTRSWLSREEVEQGCELAYCTISNIFEQGKPIFVSECSDIIEEPLARQLDQQLQDYKSMGLIPKLHLQSVSAHVLSLHHWPINFRPNFSFLPSLVGALLEPISMSIYLMITPEDKLKLELLCCCEFTTEENFELVVPIPLIN